MITTADRTKSFKIIDRNAIYYDILEYPHVNPNTLSVHIVALNANTINRHLETINDNLKDLRKNNKAVCAILKTSTICLDSFIDDLNFSVKRIDDTHEHLFYYCLSTSAAVAMHAEDSFCRFAWEGTVVIDIPTMDVATAENFYIKGDERLFLPSRMILQSKGLTCYNPFSATN